MAKDHRRRVVSLAIVTLVLLIVGAILFFNWSRSPQRELDALVRDGYTYAEELAQWSPGAGRFESSAVYGALDPSGIPIMVQVICGPVGNCSTRVIGINEYAER